MRRLINIDPNIQLDLEQKGHEFGYYVFNILPDIKTLPKQEVAINMLGDDAQIQDNNFDIGIHDTEIQKQQKKDDF